MTSTMNLTEHHFVRLASLLCSRVKSSPYHPKITAKQNHLEQRFIQIAYSLQSEGVQLITYSEIASPNDNLYHHCVHLLSLYHSIAAKIEIN